MEDRRRIEMGLEQNAKRRREARGKLLDARQELATLLVEGSRAGVPVAVMARAAEISRDTAHRFLREQGGAPSA
jgi:DNA invertase Pin-like site-specific DNA recombinase